MKNNVTNATTYAEIFEKNLIHREKDDFEIVKYIDQGRFSCVFQAVSTAGNHPCIIKIMKVWDTLKLNKEVHMLIKLRNISDVIKLIGFCNSSHSYGLIFESIGVDVDSFCHGGGELLNASEVKIYFLKLLRVLEKCHDLNIMHRDIKVGYQYAHKNVTFERFIIYDLFNNSFL